MRSRWSALALGILVSNFAAAQFADYRFVPASKEAESGPAPAVLEAWLQLPAAALVYGDFAGQNAALAAAKSERTPLRAAEGIEVNLDAALLFPDAIPHGTRVIRTTSVTSLDAHAIRLQLDLSGLIDGAELWLLDPEAPRAHGPYTAFDDEPGGRWLPVIFGDTARLVLSTPDENLPDLTLRTLSHFYLDPIDAAKQNPCPVHAACETGASFQEVSTGIGLMMIPSGFGQVLCTGALINNADTAALEPLLLSAAHCFDSGINAADIEVLWDFRAVNCAGEGVPEPDSLPHSEGKAILAQNRRIDGTLLELRAVPVGARGRAWLGWDTQPPGIGDPIRGIHHPGGRSMKVAIGTVTALNQDACFDILCAQRVVRQTRVRWDEGITEGGSSGSPLLYTDRNLRILGMLSNGAVHACGNPTQNIDQYASFREFFSQIGCFLTASGSCAPGPMTDCPAKAAFGADSDMVAELRAFRDNVLAKTPWGRKWIDAYYEAAPQMAAIVEQSPEAKGLFAAAAIPFALFSALVDND